MEQTNKQNAVIQLARDRHIPGVDHYFSKIIYVGHSVGSVLGNGLTIQYPNDADAVILTDFTQYIFRGFAFVDPVLGPAAVVSPDRFSFLALDPTYVMLATEHPARRAFYYGDYDEAEFEYDYSTRGTATLGEIATLQLGQLYAPDYKSPLYVLNGLEDLIFCKDAPDTAANCTTYTPGVRQLYPNVRTFGFYNTANTGHCLNVHHTARKSFIAAHQFLELVGY